ncbi:hypothetical protein EDC96DRAFT_544848 [Choanephora cucurbitarum]|nr:hypothetical protein EDC96DRAFT_549948 [Choanephora cucurbitarum]KAI8364533.1 hypothetical protein EDC96DRAFT_544848 [Choanephora cucurbitarum]
MNYSKVQHPEERSVFQVDVVGLDQLYDAVCLDYQTDFPNANYEDVFNYKNAAPRPFKVSSSLPYNCPCASKWCAHFTLLLQEGLCEQSACSGSFICNSTLIPQIDFQLLYSRQTDKRNLWSTIFDLRRIETKCFGSVDDNTLEFRDAVKYCDEKSQRSAAFARYQKDQGL